MKCPLLAALLLAPLPALLLAADPKPKPPAPRSVTTDEPLRFMGKPEGAADYAAKTAATDGQNLALTLHKLEHGFDPPRPFLIWALGSSYTNMLGSGEPWLEAIPKQFPQAPPIRYEKMVGNSCPWQYLRGWARHLAIPDQPDLVITYTNGKPADLEKLIVELRTHTTADIIVPSLHWRERDQPLWGQSENATDQDIAAVREVCRKYDVEFVENRRDWAEYLTANNLPITALLKDAVHQSNYGAQIINTNILAHVRKPEKFSYDPAARERRIQPVKGDDGSFEAAFTGNRIDLIGKKSPAGGTFRVLIDGKPADQTAAFLMSYVQPDKNNAAEGKGANPRDQSPHGITLGTGVIPQSWTLVMTSDSGDFELTGSRTGPDGRGNAFQPFTSTSGQILIEPDLWRRAERNRTGDRFSFAVHRSVLEDVSFQGEPGARFSVRVAQVLANTAHTLKLVPITPGEAVIDALDVFEPPMKKP
jgi:hypothetical protein